jgi:hypothetical protein
MTIALPTVTAYEANLKEMGVEDESGTGRLCWWNV